VTTIAGSLSLTAAKSLHLDDDEILRAVTALTLRHHDLVHGVDRGDPASLPLFESVEGGHPNT
jgi:hypothetical protein